MNKKTKKCPNCSSSEFVSEPNCYDVLEFVNGDFQIIRQESCDDECKIFCRECGVEVLAKNGEIVCKENLI